MSVVIQGVARKPKDNASSVLEYFCDFCDFFNAEPKSPSVWAKILKSDP